MGGSPSKLDKHFFFTSSLCKTLMRFCFVSIVRKEKKIKKKYKIQKDTHEESLEDFPSRWWRKQMTSENVRGLECIRLFGDPIMIDKRSI